MPVVRLPRPRRSARLKGVQTLSRKGARTMEPTQGPITRGRGGKNRGGRGSGTSNPDTASGRLVIQWQADVTHTQRVVEHLHSHPADCHMLFHSDGKQANTEGDRPSGKDKLSVCAVIARHVFERDAEYAVQFQSVPDKFRDSTNNHINGLRKKYRECHDKLHATGAGVIPQDNTSAQNLHAQILEEFPWYDDLAAILGTNPALSLKTVSSQPGMDHASNYFRISRTAGSSYSQGPQSALLAIMRYGVR
ncbi:hypothetical protein P692DRAFT_201893657 [Suillus brevipes Sb2]|nr:hypothetical protein P692DRAFT_201893657 [Suillus brevipes Sb2]